MKKASKSLARTVSRKLDLNESTREFQEAYAYCLSYLTNGITAYQFQAVIKQYLPAGEKRISAKVFRLHLMSNKYNYFTVKLYILQLCKVRRGDSEAAKSLAKQTGILKRDAALIFQLWEASPSFRRRIREWIATLPKHIDLTVKGLEKEFSRDIYPGVSAKIRSLSYQKLRFIAKTANQDLKDLHGELSLKALQAYYKVVPDKRGSLFVVNYLKQTVHNHAMNMIQTATSQKGGRLVDNGVDENGVRREATLLVVSENQMLSSVNQDGDRVDTPISVGSIDPTESIENEISVSTLLDKYKTRTKKHRLLLILMGSVDEEFTIWLRSRKHCNPREDNSDLQDRIDTTAFRKFVSQFLHIDDDKVGVFLTELQKKMSERSDRKPRGTQNESRKKTNSMLRTSVLIVRAPEESSSSSGRVKPSCFNFAKGKIEFNPRSRYAKC